MRGNQVPSRTLSRMHKGVFTMSTATLHGQMAAPGYASGPAHCYTFPDLLEDPGELPEDASTLAECGRLEAGLAEAEQILMQHYRDLYAAERDEEAEIFLALAALVQDRSFVRLAEGLITDTGITAEHAAIIAADHEADLLEELPDEQLRLRGGDMRELGRLVMRVLRGETNPWQGLTHPAIIVAPDLGPSELMSLPREHVLGIALAAGGIHSHVAILARSLGIPMLVGLGDTLLEHVQPDMPLALDGTTGQLLLNPSAAEQAAMHERNAQAVAREAALRNDIALPTVTSDGHVIRLMANVANAQEAQRAQEWGAAGVGLLRSELLCAEASFWPTEAQQLALYQAVSAALPDQPITIRTFDIGGDKRFDFMRYLNAPALTQPTRRNKKGKTVAPAPPAGPNLRISEANPALGWRGLRLALSHPELVLLPQLRAILRLGAGADVRILLPMVTNLAELQQARALLEQAQQELASANLPHARQVQLGIMIEVPAAALNSASLAPHADFFAIGTNDLTQYTLACDRNNSHVAALYQPFDPALLRLIEMACSSVHPYGRSVSLCGDLSSDPRATALLIGLGVDTLSCTPAALPHVRAAIRATNYQQARALARHALNAPSAQAVLALLAP
ncbi:MAG: phosphoenolpyruvate--protein phosphotransferase [Candidatus Viridilinea halotolerans]|uniref:Phosphoenolpyruvate-protein phosphotransferase n=1 Tax=Candidatus Viridilinea halotolerans TaxID=2491704 RepID=A0A426TYW5_9CHLR|nr:MAG: phosphoenolpyruvate--protein phosphotransferase [Candidatus Viridilinea halotolerans]